MNATARPDFTDAVARARAALRTVHPFNGRSEFVSVAAIKAAAGQLGPGMERADLEAVCAHIAACCQRVYEREWETGNES